MKVKKIRAAVAGQDKLDAAISEAIAPEKTRAAEARVFKDSKSTVNLRNAPSPSGDLFDTNARNDSNGSLSSVAADIAAKFYEAQNHDDRYRVDYTSASVEILQSLVAQGHIRAAFELGRVYALGLVNVEKSYELASVYFTCGK